MALLLWTLRLLDLNYLLGRVGTGLGTSELRGHRAPCKITQNLGDQAVCCISPVLHDCTIGQKGIGMLCYGILQHSSQVFPLPECHGCVSMGAGRGGTGPPKCMCLGTLEGLNQTLHLVSYTQASMFPYTGSL